MRRVLALLVLLGLAPAYADDLLPKAEPQTINTIPQLTQALEPTIQNSKVLPAGTPIQVVLDQDIDADHVKVGQTVDGHIMMPVKHEGQIVFPIGTPVKGVVTHKKNNSIAGVPGSIELGNFKIVTSQNAIVPLSGSFQKTGDSRIAGAVAGGYFLLLPIFIKGQDGRLPRGAESTMFTLQEWEYTSN
jgi:hypothetical protein